MCRPASFDSELEQIYPKLENWYIHKFKREPDQDAIQEAAIRALENWEDYDPGRCKLSTWVIRILINVELARNKHHNMHHPSGRICGEFSSEMYNNFDMEVIKKTFRKLVPRQKAVLRLKAQGLKNSEIAKKIRDKRLSGCINSPGTIKSFINLSRRTFKRELEKAGYPIL